MLLRKSIIVCGKFPALPSQIGGTLFVQDAAVQKTLFVWVRFDLKPLIPSLADIIARSSKLQMWL